jgi:hypothetical protein
MYVVCKGAKRKLFFPVHAKTYTTAKKTKYREKIRKIITVGLSLVLRKKCILKIQVQRGLYFTEFFQIQRANVCIEVLPHVIPRNSPFCT